jgi:hypothetical protein
MKPYLGAVLIYRPRDGKDQLDDLAAICTGLFENGAIVLKVFPPFADPHSVIAKGWSCVGSNPEQPNPGTWRWRSFLDELGPHGRTLIAEIMTRPAEWARVLLIYDNFADYRRIYREQREAAIARDWPELPPEEALKPEGTVLQ